MTSLYGQLINNEYKQMNTKNVISANANGIQYGNMIHVQNYTPQGYIFSYGRKLSTG